MPASGACTSRCCPHCRDCLKSRLQQGSCRHPTCRCLDLPHRHGSGPAGDPAPPSAGPTLVSLCPQGQRRGPGTDQRPSAAGWALVKVPAPRHHCLWGCCWSWFPRRGVSSSIPQSVLKCSWEERLQPPPRTVPASVCWQQLRVAADILTGPREPPAAPCLWEAPGPRSLHALSAGCRGVTLIGPAG